MKGRLRSVLLTAALAVAVLPAVLSSAMAAQFTEVLVHREPGIGRFKQEPSGVDVTPSYWMRFREDGSACLVGSWNYKPTGLFVGHYSRFSDLADAVNALGFLGLPNIYPTDGSVVLDADEITVSVVADGKTDSVMGPLHDAVEPTQLKNLLTLIDKIASSIHWTATNTSCL